MITIKYKQYILIDSTTEEIVKINTLIYSDCRIDNYTKNDYDTEGIHVLVKNNNDILYRIIYSKNILVVLSMIIYSDVMKKYSEYILNILNPKSFSFAVNSSLHFKIAVNTPSDTRQIGDFFCCTDDNMKVNEVDYRDYKMFFTDRAEILTENNIILYYKEVNNDV